MPKFTDIVATQWQAQQRKIVLGLSLVVFLSIGTYLFVYYALPLIQKKEGVKNTGDVPNTAERAKPVDIYFFNTDWCPHCTKSKPDWEHFVDKYDGTVVNGSKIHCVGGKNGVNCTDMDNADVQDSIQRFKVEHYPTVKLKRGDEIIDYEAKVTYDNLKSFVETVLA